MSSQIAIDGVAIATRIFGPEDLIAGSAFLAIHAADQEIRLADGSVRFVRQKLCRKAEVKLLGDHRELESPPGSGCGVTVLSGGVTIASFRAFVKTRYDDETNCTCLELCETAL